MGKPVLFSSVLGICDTAGPASGLARMEKLVLGHHGFGRTFLSLGL